MSCTITSRRYLLLAVVLLLSLALSASATHRKRHVVSKSTYQTSRGHTHDPTAPTYEGQGTSHITKRWAPMVGDNADAVYLTDPAVYANATALVLAQLGSNAKLLPLQQIQAAQPEQVRSNECE